MYESTEDVAKKIVKENIVQVLESIDVVKPEMRANIFKTEKKMPGTTVTKKAIARVVKAIPYVAPGTPAVSLNGKATNYTAYSVPPMSANMRIEDTEFALVRQLEKKDVKAWLKEKLTETKEDINMNIEWYLRSLMTTGSVSYKFKVGDEYDTVDIDLGTPENHPAPTVLHDNSSITLAMVLKYFYAMLTTGNDANPSRFTDPEDVIIYTPTAVWDVYYDLLQGQTIQHTLQIKHVSKNDLLIGSFIVRRFDGKRKDPETQASVDSMVVKQLRMIDVKNSKHTLALMRLANLNAQKGSSQHMMFSTIQDPYGKFVDLSIEYQPLAMMDTTGMVTTAEVIS